MRDKGERLTMGVGQLTTATMKTMMTGTMTLAMTEVMKRRSITHLHLHLPFITESSSLSPRLKLLITGTMRTGDMRIMGLEVKSTPAMPSMTPLTQMTTE